MLQNYNFFQNQRWMKAILGWNFLGGKSSKKSNF